MGDEVFARPLQFCVNPLKVRQLVRQLICRPEPARVAWRRTVFASVMFSTARGITKVESIPVDENNADVLRKRDPSISLPASVSGPRSLCEGKSRVPTNSLRISRWRIRKSSPSKVDSGGFLAPSAVDAAVSDSLHSETASCAMSSKMAGCGAVRCLSYGTDSCSMTSLTFAKSCSCESTHIVLRNVGYHVSVCSTAGAVNSLRMLSSSLGSVLDETAPDRTG